MIPVEEAIDRALAATPVLTQEEVPLVRALGRVVAEGVITDVDMPPFDKSSMDGYAVQHADLQESPVDLEVAGFVAAGTHPDFKLHAGQAAKIMTGAPVPDGADAVQMVEKTTPQGESKVTIREAVKSGQHIAVKGEIMRVGDVVVAPGTRISPAVSGVLATVGAAVVKVYRQPKVAILVTGDELVEVEAVPGPGQIRNSNGHTLYNQVIVSGAIALPLGIAPDDTDRLRQMITRGLESDMLLISGGVSMGDLDLVEEVFDSLDVEIYYDKVDIKPGKPTVCGKHGNTVVFGLPGNPVSASTIYDVVVSPCLRKMMGLEQLHHIRLQARMSRAIRSKTRRCYYAPAWSYSDEKQQLCTTPVATKGSADVLAYGRSNSYLVVPGDVDEIAAGQPVEVLLRNEF